MRWLMDLQEFEFSIQHRAGTSHCNADALSRLVNKKFDRTTVFSDLKRQRRKSPPNRDKAPMKTIDVNEPFTFWALDYMGPVSETARGNKYILVVMDHFTKWCEAFPTKDQKASTVADCLISKVFSRFGPPLVLHSDQGSNFESTLMHEICNIMGVTKTRTTAYHPCCNGQVERQNRTLQDMLANYVSSRADDWDLLSDPVLFAYNTSKHESTGFAPY